MALCHDLAESIVGGVFALWAWTWVELTLVLLYSDHFECSLAVSPPVPPVPTPVPPPLKRKDITPYDGVSKEEKAKLEAVGGGWVVRGARWWTNCVIPLASLTPVTSVTYVTPD